MSALFEISRTSNYERPLIRLFQMSRHELEALWRGRPRILADGAPRPPLNGSVSLRKVGSFDKQSEQRMRGSYGSTSVCLSGGKTVLGKEGATQVL